MKYIPLFLFASICFVINACNRNPKVIYPDADIIANFSYQPGTYWIYRDSLSGEVDSFYVTSAFSQNAEASGQLLNSIYINIIERNLAAINSDSIAWREQLTENFLEYGICLVYYPFSVEQIEPPGGGGDNGYLLNIYNNYIVAGQSYQTVAEISHASIPDPMTTSYYIDTFYMNANVGMIKMILNEKDTSLNIRVWELQRYKIVK